MITVISLGGSIIAPDKIDTVFLKKFVQTIEELLNENSEYKFIFVTGGGGTARVYQNALYDAGGSGSENADWIGIMATRLNAQLIKALFSKYCPQDVITDPTRVDLFLGRIMVAAGWKPGFSSDNDAVLLAERFDSKTVINLSNIEKVYTDDPKKNPNAKPIDKISWKDFRALVGDEWVPGKNVPFDPIASANAQAYNIKVICAEGHNLLNLKNIINGKAFTGTTIGEL
jgi:uridylate kinase